MQTLECFRTHVRGQALRHRDSRLGKQMQWWQVQHLDKLPAGDGHLDTPSSPTRSSDFAGREMWQAGEITAALCWAAYASCVQKKDVPF